MLVEPPPMGLVRVNAVLLAMDAISYELPSIEIVSPTDSSVRNSVPPLPPIEAEPSTMSAKPVIEVSVG